MGQLLAGGGACAGVELHGCTFTPHAGHAVRTHSLVHMPICLASAVRLYMLSSAVRLYVLSSAVRLYVLSSAVRLYMLSQHPYAATRLPPALHPSAEEP